MACAAFSYMSRDWDPNMTFLANRPIVKMNGIGNAIAVLDLRGSDHVVSGDEARAINRVPGLVFDQLMVLHDAGNPRSAARLMIYNNDGSISDACGNGTRCVAYLMMRDGRETELLLESRAGPLHVTREGKGSFTVDMGAPRFSWREIPLAHSVADTAHVPLDPPVAGAPRNFAAVSMGNPHAVFFVPDLRQSIWRRSGRRSSTIRSSPSGQIFPLLRRSGASASSCEFGSAAPGRRWPVARQLVPHWWPPRAPMSPNVARSWPFPAASSRSPGAPKMITC